MGAFDLGSSSTISRAAASVQGIPAGLLTAKATSVVAMVIAAAAAAGVTNLFDGTENTLAGTGSRMPPRRITITTGASVGTYRTGAANAIQVTGTYGRRTVTETVLLTNANGGETVKTVSPFDPQSVTITIPGQVNAGGTISVGVGEICCPADAPYRGVKTHADYATFKYFDENGQFDSMPMTAGQVEPILVSQVDLSNNVGVTLYK